MSLAGGEQFENSDRARSEKKRRGGVWHCSRGEFDTNSCLEKKKGKLETTSVVVETHRRKRMKREN